MKNSAMKTATVTRVGHPLPHPATPGQATEMTISVYTENGYSSFPASPLSILIRKGDTLTVAPDGSLYKVNNFTIGMLNQYLLGFEGRIDRVSHPLWLKNSQTGQPELCVIIACDNLLCPIKADWNTLLLRDNDLISTSIHNKEAIFFENYTLGTSKTPRFSKLKGQINRVAHPLACPDINGKPCLQTMIIMANGECKILKATPESMFLQDGDKVEISDSYIINERILQFSYCNLLPGEYKIKYLSHPLSVTMPDGTKRLSRYIMTTENKIYRVNASEDNMLLLPGDTIISVN